MASAQDFQIIIDSSLNKLVLDVRDSSEFLLGHIPGSILAPTKKILLEITDTIDKETTLLIYCSKGIRSKQASELLIQKGFLNIIDLNHGFDEWKEKSMPIEIPNQK